MPTKNILGSLLALQVALWIAQRAAAGAVYEMYGYVDPVTTLFGFSAGFGVFLVLGLALVGSCIGLIRFSPVARTFYLIVNILAIVLGLLHGPIVRSGAVDFCYSANILLTGVILAMVYSPLFKNTSEALASAAPPVTGPVASPSAVRPPGVRVPPSPAPEPFCLACAASTHGAKFCPKCGTPVVTRKVCSRCGVEAIPGEKFCRECGNPTP